MLSAFTKNYKNNPKIKKLIEETEHQPDTPIILSGLWGASKAQAVAAYREESRKPILILTGNSREAEDFYEDILSITGEKKGIYYFPYTEVLPYEEISPFNDIVHQRIDVFHAVLNETSPIVIAPVRAILSRLIPIEGFIDAAIVIKTGEIIEISELAKELIHLGYKRTLRVERSGEFSIKGGILDVFPSTMSDPCRIEFFDIEIDSIRVFNVESQVSINKIDNIMILPQREILLKPENREKALGKLKEYFPKSKEREKLESLIKENHYFPGIENYLPLFFDKTSSLMDFFTTAPVIIETNPESVSQNLDSFKRDIDDLYSGYFTKTKIKLHPDMLFFKDKPDTWLRLHTLAGQSANEISMNVQSPREYLGNIEELEKDIKSLLDDDYTILLIAGYEGQAKRLADLISEFDPHKSKTTIKKKKVNIIIAALSSGFTLPDEKLAVILEREIFNRKRSYRKKFREVHSLPVNSFLDLKPGDYVVHINHGIGIFKSIERITATGQEKDYLKLEYRDSEILYVPLEMINLVQRYIGQGGKNPRIDTLGGKSWKKAREKVRKSVEEMAKELVRIYSARMKKQGYKYGSDTKWQHEFESSFSFEETPDQQKAIDEVKADMESTRPMDRLICGDVGFGKTEVAVRGAFKTALEGRQTAVLVPTTILAEQHYRTFKDRFASYPVKVDYLNRFRTSAEQKKIIAALNEGKIDVIIGTHRILSNDVLFKNLGLVVIDEEQRFGVKHKERLKKIRTLVDVITMTATPIPRTLHLSLIKVRDMSIINTPPQSRLPIETYVMEFNENLVKRAIMQELNRDGQVYYLHNRVKTIGSVEEFLKNLIPKARIGVAHGQLHEHHLEEVMKDFIDGKIDILLSTSIIESGLDIPNANTLIVDRADAFGLSQLYQIRGRVGRTQRQAFAYLFYPPDKPLSEISQKRLQIINEFSDLGSGFHIAMRDMEIRGVGNLFGREQSGDIITVGFDMYCHMMEEAVKELEIEEYQEPIETIVDLNFDSGFIPETYIEDDRQKIEIYKRIASCFSQEEIITLKAEVEDRFGKMPDDVKALFHICELKAEGRKTGIKSILQQNTIINIEFDKNNSVNPQKAALLIQTSKNVKIIPGDRMILQISTSKARLSDKVEDLKNILQELC